MKKTENFTAKKKGLYKIAFTICILFLSSLVVTISEKGKNVEVTDTSIKKSVSADVINEFEIDKALSGLTEQENEMKNAKISETSDTEPKRDISIKAPLYGKVQKAFSDDVPIYSKTMDDWRIHTGVDIASYVGADVYAAQSGTVTDVGYDINFGNYVTVANGDFELRYTSLSSNIDVSIGQEVSQGQHLGVVSESCISEICDEPHLHFEIKLAGEYVNPQEYILFE